MSNYQFENNPVPIFANESYGTCDKEKILPQAEAACAALLAALGIDCENDPNVMGTPRRMARMYVNELLRGRYEPAPDVREFPNSHALDQLYVVGPIKITSLCSHHFLPFVGSCFIGILPQANMPVLGLSKFARFAEWIFARPQIQEEATIQLANLLEKTCKPVGLGVVVQAVHMCMSLRGVKQENSKMTTSVMRGALRENATARQEFLTFVRNSGGNNE